MALKIYEVQELQPVSEILKWANTKLWLEEETLLPELSYEQMPRVYPTNLLLQAHFAARGDITIINSEASGVMSV